MVPHCVNSQACSIVVALQNTDQTSSNVDASQDTDKASSIVVASQDTDQAWSIVVASQDTDQASSIVVASQDTDVGVLLPVQFDKMKCQTIWMKTGAAGKGERVPIHPIPDHSGIERGPLQNQARFDALTRCVVTSFLAGDSRKLC